MDYFIAPEERICTDNDSPYFHPEVSASSYQSVFDSFLDTSPDWPRASWANDSRCMD